MRLSEYRESTDSVDFWRLDSVDIQNLLEEAVKTLDASEAEVERLTAENQSLREMVEISLRAGEGTLDRETKES